MHAGVEDENLATRRDTIRLHIQNLMEDMYREEEVLKAKLIESVAHCTKELAELCNQLSLPFDGVRLHSRIGTLVQLCAPSPSPCSLLMTFH